MRPAEMPVLAVALLVVEEPAQLTGADIPAEVAVERGLGLRQANHQAMNYRLSLESQSFPASHLPQKFRSVL